MKDTGAKDYRIIAFEPEEDLIYVCGNTDIHELNIAQKRE